MPQIEKKSERSIKPLQRLKWQEITTLFIGSASVEVYEPNNDLELKNLILHFKQNKIKFIIVGNGSNIVGTDKNIYDAVIRLSGKFFREISFGREHITVGAGVSLRELAIQSAKKGFGGLAALAGIPATVGGAIRMNAGCGGVQLSSFIEEICGIDFYGNIWNASKNEISFSYRVSSLEDDKIILAAILRLYQSTPEAEEKKIEEEITRRSKQKFEGRNAGCVFLNPGNVSAGTIIEKSGCKGMREGDAMISQTHANYFVNLGNCSEEDFITLICKARKIVFEKTGILLTPELKFINPESFKRVISEPKQIKVSILKGGTSRERDISLISASYVAKALCDAGMLVSQFDIKSPEIPKEVEDSDVIFPVLHGGFGEDGTIQKKLEEKSLKFVGSGSHSSSITIDKIETKKIMISNGIPTADFEILTQAHDKQELAKIAKSLGYPIVLKAPKEGSTFGISIVEREEDLQDAIKEISSIDHRILVEKFISGREITVGILNGKAMPVIEIEYPGKTYDFDAKYTHNKGETKYHCPPLHISEQVQKKAQEYSEILFKAVGARDMLRVDFICANDDKLYALEANSIPGFTESSLLPKAAAAAGISFIELCAKLVVNALNK